MFRNGLFLPYFNELTENKFQHLTFSRNHSKQIAPNSIPLIFEDSLKLIRFLIFS